MEGNHFFSYRFFSRKSTKWKFLLYLLPVYLLILLHYCPSILLHHTFKYRNFTVHSSEPIDKALTNVLDNSLTRLRRSEINNPNRPHQLYLCESYAYAKFFGIKLFRAFAWNDTFHRIFIVKTDAKNDLCFRNDTNHNSASLSQTIAHEIVHSFQRDEWGWIGMRCTPEWKIEGYAMYASKQDTFNLAHAKKEIQLYREQSSFPANYTKYDIATLYLFQKKNYTLKDLKETELSLEDVLNEIEAL